MATGFIFGCVFVGVVGFLVGYVAGRDDRKDNV